MHSLASLSSVVCREPSAEARSAPGVTGGGRHRAVAPGRSRCFINLCGDRVFEPRPGKCGEFHLPVVGDKAQFDGPSPEGETIAIGSPVWVSLYPN